MKAVLAGGAEIEIGTAEENPTIGITDYSRRVTDDFGTTTVVERGFARRMSVRVSLPSDQVSAVQRELAGLRATAARWEADDRFDWLNFEGFYKDFSIDLEVGAISFCTLTVEGLAETEAGADTGEDPAPSGSSTMILVQPVQISGAMLTASNVPETDYAEWSAAATYAAGVRAIKAATHKIYESAGNGNLGHDPAAADGMWFEVGPTNRWAMFDQALGTVTSRAGGITLTLAPGAVTAVALLDVVAATVRVQVGVYDRTIAVANGAVTFLDLPGAGGAITVTISGAGTVSVGTLIVGKLVELGLTEEKPSVGITDFSRKEVDDFGEVTIVPRAWSKNMSPATLIATEMLDVVANRIASVRARPSLWIANEGTDALTVYGFFKDFSIEVGQTVSKVSLSIEGLSEAADFADPTARAAVQYAEGQTYRAGDVVAISDGSTWLYINRIPTIGNAPPQWPATANAYWSLMTAPTNRGRLFVQVGAPTAADSVAGDMWQDSSARYWDRRRDNHLGIGANRLTIGGNLLSIAWTPTPLQPVRDQIDAALLTSLNATAAAAELAKNAQATADGKVQSFYQPAAPAAEGIGDLWFDTDDGNKQYRWSGTAWEPVQDSGIGAALTAAAGAQATADGKVTTFFGESAPTPEGVGDLWFIPSTGYLSRWNGAAWIEVSNIGATSTQIADIAQALTDASNAQATADGKIDSFYQTAAPVGASEGDLWFDTDDGNKSYRHNGATWVEVQDSGIGAAISAAAGAQATADGKITTFVGEVAPTPEGVGDLWFKASTGILQRWSGSAWADVGTVGATAAQVADIAQALTDAGNAQATADGKVATFSSESAPTADGIGDLWFKPSTGILQRWSGSAWVNVATIGATVAQLADIAQALSDASNAQATADGKIDSFYQPTAPTGASVGDLWFDTDEGNKPYRWSGSAWVAVQDSGIGTAISAAAGAQATADGKVTTFVGETAPTATAPGDLWFKASTGELRRWSGAAWGDPMVDLTAAAQIVVVPPVAQKVARDWEGTPKVGQLPRVLTPGVTRGGVDKRTDNATTYSVTATGGLDGHVTVNNTNGSADKGKITIADTMVGAGTINLVVSYNGISQGTFPIKVEVVDDDPPGGGGGGGGSAGTINTGVVGTTPAAVTGDLNITVAAGGIVRLSASYDFITSAASGSQSLTVQFYEWNGSAYVAIGSAVAASSVYIPAVGEPGSGSIYLQLNGQTVGSAKKYKLYAWASGGSTGSIRSVSGSANASTE